MYPPIKYINGTTKEVYNPLIHNNPQDGYGSKLHTSLMFKPATWGGTSTKWYKVFASCFGNSASFWVMINKVKYHID